MLSFLRLNLLRQLDTEGILDVSHYENILLKAFEKAGFDEQTKPATAQDFTNFRLAIDTEIEKAEWQLEESRKKAKAVVEAREYTDQEKEELKSIVRKKFHELFNFYDSQKDMALTTFEDEFQAFVRYNYFKADHLSNISQPVKDNLFFFIYNKAKDNSNSFEDLCLKVGEYDEYLEGVIHILLPDAKEKEKEEKVSENGKNKI